MALENRFLALDVFRGMTICFMIIVNTPGSWEIAYAPLKHADWHGFTPTDLVFPSFLFAVGNALSFVMTRWSTMPASKVVTKILKRTFIIFLIGYLLYWFPFFQFDSNGSLEISPIKNTRIFGVLQRIALCYGLSALLLYFLKPKATFILTIIILVLYAPVLFWFGTGSDPLSLQTNAVLHFDKWLIGESHMYRGEGIPFDPEGFLSTFPSIANVVGGFYAGRFLQVKGKTYEALTKLLLAGGALMAIAYFWDLNFPINKKLWTSSFALYTVGLDCILIAGIIYLIDVRGKSRWTYFFEVFGRNPLFIYILSQILEILFNIITIGNESVHDWLYNHLFVHSGAYFGSLLYAIIFTMTCWAVGYWLDRRKIYIKV